MSVETLEREAADRAAAVSRQAARTRLWPVLLAALVAAAAVYHWLQSLGHETPAVFTDELMFSELARSVAAGDWLTVRGEAFSFPSILPVLVQAPVWHLHGAEAYGAVKALNALVMSLAAIPAWWLARQVVRPTSAFVVAAATVAGGAMLYHSYLTSEALAFPVFLLAVAVSIRAVAEGNRRWDAIALVVLAVAVLTRAQFVVLPIAFALTVLLAGRPLRRHALALSALGVLAVAGAVAGASQLGFYSGARELDYSAAGTVRWAGWTGALVPFAAGMLVVPGAVLGLGYAIARPFRRMEAAFGVMAVVLLVALPLEAGLIASGEASRPLERYAFYAVPLLFVSFFLYVERGAPGRALYAGLALAIGGLALAVPFASLAVEPFSFDSPTLSAVEALGRRLSPGDAAALFASLGVVASVAAAAIPLRRFGTGVAVVSIVLAFAVGVAAYSGDRRMTTRAADSLAPAQKDWLDRLGLEADVLVLPGGSLHAGWMLESWNRKAGRTFHLGEVDDDPLPHTDVGVRADGTVAAPGGEPVRSPHVVVNEAASRIQLAGRRLARPLPGLTLYRTKGPLRLRSLTEGVYADGWARGVVTYSVWPLARSGEYHVRLRLPRGRAARSVEVEAGPVRRSARLRPGRGVDLRIPAAGRPIPPLAIRLGRADLIDPETTRPRLVAARVTTLRFVPTTGSRNR